MVWHTVWFKFKEGVTDVQKQEMLDGLNDLPESIDAIQTRAKDVTKRRDTRNRKKPRRRISRRIAELFREIYNGISGGICRHLVIAKGDCLKIDGL